MMDDDFADFIRRIRSGDPEAAGELVKRYEPAIRLEVRLRLRDSRLRRLVDSMDIGQSVLASFFIRTAAGQYDLEDPQKLVKLLVSITRNKVAYHARKQRTQSRDQRRVSALDLARNLAGPDQTPSAIVADRELLQKVQERLSPVEKELAKRRGQGQGWAKIAAEMGGTPQACRMQLARALDRIAKELGVEQEQE
jgi:RNA polymerase sigma factor (sigma-70 family)